jgi:pimeloyl-ACP methyl ester carboxylesterase
MAVRADATGPVPGCRGHQRPLNGTFPDPAHAAVPLVGGGAPLHSLLPAARDRGSRARCRCAAHSSDGPAQRLGGRGRPRWRHCIPKSLGLGASARRVAVRTDGFASGPRLADRGRFGYVRAPGMSDIINAMPQFPPRLVGSIIVPGLGHWLSQESPDVVSDAVIDFARRTAR